VDLGAETQSKLQASPSLPTPSLNIFSTKDWTKAPIMSTLSTPPYSPIPLISNATFHRRITLPTPHGPQILTYALIGSNDAAPTRSRTLLFLPGMFASRYLGIPLHILAERAGVRILVVDRFGMGGSGDVPLSRRISTWCDVIPRLLEHLGIESVGLVAHSAGTIYTLNMLVDEGCRRLIQGLVVFLGMAMFNPTLLSSYPSPHTRIQLLRALLQHPGLTQPTPT
jgi:pimeloyl-ACP methyl ester carboxylesterase